MILQQENKVNIATPDIRRVGMSAAVLMYFTAIIAVNQLQDTLTSAFYYLSILTGVVIFFGRRQGVRLRPLILLAIGAGILTMLNTVLVGNETVIKSMVMVASFFVAALMLDDEVDERAFLIAIYLNAAVVLFHIALHGTNAHVYVGSSNNYVSIHLLAPALIYYSLLDARGKKIPIIPAGVIWVLCILSGGRGGFLAGTILLAGVILRRYLGDHAHRREKVLLGAVLVLILIPAVLILIMSVLNRDSDLYLINRFLDKGMDGGGRIPGWIEYITSAGKSLTGFVFGVDLDTQVWIQKYSGNLHNSFLFVHAYMGIIGFITLLVLVVRAVAWAVRTKRGIYLCCIITLCFRGMTDHMFGGNRISAVVIAILLVTEVIRRQPKKNSFEPLRGVGK